MTTHAQRVEAVCESFEETAAQHRKDQRALDEARREVPARMNAEIMALRDALAERDELISALQDRIEALSGEGVAA